MTPTRIAVCSWRRLLASCHSPLLLPGTLSLRRWRRPSASHHLVPSLSLPAWCLGGRGGGDGPNTIYQTKEVYADTTQTHRSPPVYDAARAPMDVVRTAMCPRHGVSCEAHKQVKWETTQVFCLQLSFSRVLWAVWVGASWDGCTRRPLASRQTAPTARLQRAR